MTTSTVELKQFTNCQLERMNTGRRPKRDGSLSVDPSGKKKTRSTNTKLVRRDEGGDYDQEISEKKTRTTQNGNREAESSENRKTIARARVLVAFKAGYCLATES